MTENNIKKVDLKEEYNEFESIRQVDEDGNEFWWARDLQVVLDYKKWDNFKKIIENAKTACLNSGGDILYHFP